MGAKIDSIQIGRVLTEGDPASRGFADRQWTTGFYKLPVTGPVELTRGGIEGDGIADLRVHGGPDKAVLCYAASHYQSWANEYPQLSWSPGALAENLTLSGVDESNVCIADRYRIGDCQVEVSQPRQPCWKIARRWGIKTLTKEVAQSGRTGWYLRVIETGQLQAGQTAELLERPNPQWTVARANDVMFGREVDRMASMELMAIDGLSDDWKQDIA